MKAICVLSGGMDSTTLLYHLVNKGFVVKAVTFNYGQRHKKEIAYAIKTCKKLKVEHKVVDLTSINQLLHGSALTSQEINVPEGHYADESMKITVVPNRNMIFLSLAGGYAVAEKADLLAIAVHAGDHPIYPDCRPGFIKFFERALNVGNYHQVKLYAPYLQKTKVDIVKEGFKLGIDYEHDTWSCYQGGDKPCGKCGTCVERNEALALATHELSEAQLKKPGTVKKLARGVKA